VGQIGSGVRVSASFQKITLGSALMAAKGGYNLGGFVGGYISYRYSKRTSLTITAKPSACTLTLMGTDNYSATSNNMKLVHWPLMGWAVTFGTARRGLGGAAARPGPSSLYQM